MRSHPDQKFGRRVGGDMKRMKRRHAGQSIWQSAPCLLNLGGQAEVPSTYAERCGSEFEGRQSFWVLIWTVQPALPCNQRGVAMYEILCRNTGWMASRNDFNGLVWRSLADC